MRRRQAVLVAAAVFILAIPAVGAVLFFPLMYLAGAHPGVPSGFFAGFVWRSGWRRYSPHRRG